MANGFTDEQLTLALKGALGIAPLDNAFIPDGIAVFDANPEDDPDYELGIAHPWIGEKNFSPQVGFDDRMMTPGMPGVFANANELRFTNNEATSVTVTHLLITYNAGTSWFTVELSTPVTVATGATFRRYAGTIIAKATR